LWAEDKDTADPATLQAIITGCGLDANIVMKASEAPGMAEKRESYTQFAIARGVFGAPSFVISGEIFWGQDRLDFVDRKLAA
ncbi:MAG: DsbA family protein, partial [Solimonas sp.]